jgi:hypothetical protein
MCGKTGHYANVCP